MRVGLDNISPGESTASGGPGGMRSYVQALLHYLPRVGADVSLRLLTPAWNADFSVVAGRGDVIPLAAVPRSRTRRILYQQWQLPRAIERADVDVWLALATVAPLNLRVPYVLVVQFLQF